MKKEIKSFIHYYLGCEVLFDGKIWTLYQINSKYAYLRRGKDGSDKVTVHLHEALIRLRPLPDMTEDEAADVYTIEMDRILHPPTDDHDVSRRTDFGWVVTRLDHMKIGLLIRFDGVCYKVIDEGKKPTIEPAMNQPLIFHYLLSKHFDLFGLHEAGLCLYKTKQP